MTFDWSLRSAAKHSIRFIYILYFACQIVSMMLTCLCVFFDTKINTLWLALAVPIASLMVLSYYRRFISKKKKPQMLNSAQHAEREKNRAWLNAGILFLFTTNLGLLVLAILSATGQSLSMQAIVDIYLDITHSVSQEGEILIYCFSGLVFVSRLLEMYLCREIIQNRRKKDPDNHFGHGSLRDTTRQALHTINFAVSLALNTFLTLVTLVTMGYYPSMSLESYAIALGACIGLGLVLSFLETAFYVLDLQKEEDSKTLAVVMPPACQESSNSFSAQLDRCAELEQEQLRPEEGSQKRKTKDSEDSKDRWGIMMSMVDAICI